MRIKSFFLFSVLISVFFGGCIIIYNHDFDDHTAYFNNASSHNIYIQHYSKDHDRLESDYFSAYGIDIPPHTIAEYAAPFYDSEPYIEKILIVDTDTHKLLKKVTGAAYFSMLSSPEKVIKNNNVGGKTTCYKYYFLITDEYLNDN
jgi:hypothetical protein